MSKRIDLYKKQSGRFLRPGDVGSTILWHVTAYLAPRGYGKNKDTLIPHLQAECSLSDCSRMISWSMGEKGDIVKLDGAIEELTAMRDALKKAWKKAKGYDSKDYDDDEEGVVE